MAKPLEGLFSGFRRTRAAPTQTLGAPGTAIYGGYIQQAENNPNISSQEERYKTYSELLGNVSVVAAGVRYFLNLTASAEWSFTPSEADSSGEFAELAEQIFTEDPQTPFHRIVRRAAMYRFYGFSIQEWTTKKRDDGTITYKDVAPRAQRTIERWDMDVEGNILGAIQKNPQDQMDIYLPRKKLLYMVDDTLDDSPEGLGLFRHLIAPADRLRRYEQLEGFGFETDLRGIPIGRGPFTELAKMVANGQITAADRTQIEAPLRQFIANHIKNPKLGLLLDSQTFTSQDDAASPSSNRQWDIELLTGSSNSQGQLADSISRVNREMARILGVEQLLLGEDSSGSFALSKDKTQSFFLLIQGTLKEIKESFEADLLDPIWQLNGWDPELKPELSNEAVQFQDVEQISAALRDMATAGAVLHPSDPAINEVRDLLGLSHQPEIEEMNEFDNALFEGNEQSQRVTPAPAPEQDEEELPNDGDD